MSKEHSALRALEQYFCEAIEFLNRKRPHPPDARQFAEHDFSGSTVRETRYFSDGDLPYVTCVIHDDREPTRTRIERKFDPWYFVALRLLELSGGRIRFDRSKNDQYHYLSFAGPKGKVGNHYLRRAIANTPWWCDTREERRSKDEHYDYRRATFRRAAKWEIIEKGQKTRAASRTRDDAIRFAEMLFKNDRRRDEAWSDFKFGARKYGKFLRLAFEIADAIHEECLIQGLASARKQNSKNEAHA